MSKHCYGYDLDYIASKSNFLHKARRMKIFLKVTTSFFLGLSLALVPAVLASAGTSPIVIPQGDTTFVTVQPTLNVTSQSATTTEYIWSGSATIYYGYCDLSSCVTIGSALESWTANLNGQQVKFSQYLSVLTGPALEVTENWQCRDYPGGQLCNTFHNSVDFAYGYSTGRVGYSYVASNSETYAYLPDPNSNYNIYFNWNWAAQGVSNPNTVNGRFNAPPLRSPEIQCISALNPACAFV